MSEVEALDRSRRGMILGVLVGFAAWQGFSIAELLLGNLSRGVRVTLTGVSLVGGAYWCFYFIRLLQWFRRVGRDPKLATSLFDERVREAASKATRVAFPAVVVVQIIPLLSAIPAEVAARLTIAVGVITLFGAWLVFDRE